MAFVISKLYFVIKSIYAFCKMYPYGLIGNCQVSALCNLNGSIDWLCLPRPDSPPVFGRLLDERGGHFAITPSGKFSSTQEYIRNTNVLVTHFSCEDGSEFQVTDFCPRFEQHGRMFRPNSIFRIVKPLKGHPQIRVNCTPVIGWEKERAAQIRGNSHLKFEIRGEYLRLATNMPLTYVTEDISFSLTEKIFFGLTWGSPIEDDLPTVTNHFLEQTLRYWRTWVKHCSIPTRYQNETIRSALILKLHCFEDTGAILAALTTSLPEEPGNERNWDYRFCWLRDAAFVLMAFHHLGQFEEMEGFIKFLLNLGKKYENSKEGLRPVYALDQSLPLPEVIHENWHGWKNSGPVRHNNQAAEHTQHDVYGEMILALAPIFFDERFFHLRTPEYEELLQDLAHLCVRNISKPDAGLWEVRDGWQEHSFSNLMSWAGIERVLRICELGYLKSLDKVMLKQALQTAEDAVFAASVDNSIRNGPKDPTFDSALLLLPILRFPNRKVCRKTVYDIAKHLRLKEGQENFLYRYLRNDDFGKPHSAFIICSFWLVEALAKIGTKKLPIAAMTENLKAANHLGLFAEHFLPKENMQLGNFPQAYSHVGLINAAFAVSPDWDKIL
jgi:GH15 family glucan-1,4-alpha-glucosidase